MPGRQWIRVVLWAKCHHHKCARIQRAGVVGRITEWEEGPDSIKLCGICRLTHIGSVPVWFDHQRCDFQCYRCTNTDCIRICSTYTHYTYTRTSSFFDGDGFSQLWALCWTWWGEETTLDHVTCHVTNWGHSFICGPFWWWFSLHVHLNAIVNPVCVCYSVQYCVIRL